MRKLGIILLAGSLLALASAAGAVTVGFDGQGLVHGEVVDTDFAALGISSISATNLGGGPNLAIVFDSERSPALEANDDDLLRLDDGWDGGNLASDTVLNLVLVIQENTTGCGNVCDDADDEGSRPAGFFEIVFSTSVLSFGFDVVDIEDPEDEAGAVTFFQGATSVTRTWADLIAADATLDFGNNSLNRIAALTASELGLTGIDKVRIDMGGSGGIDNLQFVPEPGLPLLMLMAAAAVWRTRRRL